MKFWFGKRGWGWRLWGISYRNIWFLGFSFSVVEARSSSLPKEQQ